MSDPTGLSACGLGQALAIDHSEGRLRDLRQSNQAMNGLEEEDKCVVVKASQKKTSRGDLESSRHT